MATAMGPNRKVMLAEHGPQTPGAQGKAQRPTPRGGEKPPHRRVPNTGTPRQGGRGPEPPGRPHPDRGGPQHATHPSQGGGATGDPDPERPTRTEAQQATPTRPEKKREQDNKIETKEPLATVTACMLGQITLWEP